MDQFDQTREEWLNNENKILEAQYKIQDNNYTKLTEKLNYDLEITNNELQELDYYLSKAEDDFYKIAEAASHMVDDDGKLAQVGYYQEIYNHQQAHIEALKAAYAAGDISEPDYVEGLKEAKDAIYE
jgi:phage-related tail protein